jgi:hypothetical protein
MSYPLNRVVWNALAGRQAAFAEGGAAARRYRPDIIPFGAVRDRSTESLAALASLIKPGEVVVQVETEAPALPPGLVGVRSGDLVQMVLTDAPVAVADARIEMLAEADATEMLALAQLTEPGPFTLKARALGTFYGIRSGGRLVAMAGERMKNRRPLRGERRVQPSGFSRARAGADAFDFRDAEDSRARRDAVSPRVGGQCERRPSLRDDRVQGAGALPRTRRDEGGVREKCPSTMLRVIRGIGARPFTGETVGAAD